MEALTDSVAFTVRMVSTTHYFLKAVSLQQPLVWKWWVECTFEGQRKGVKSLRLQGSRSQVDWWSSNVASFIIRSGIVTSKIAKV